MRASEILHTIPQLDHFSASGVKGEIISPLQKIYPLELSSPEILNDVPIRVKDSSDTSDNDDQHTVTNEQSFEPKYLPEEHLETLKMSRFGRQIVPVVILDL
ncbi:hypothetical protein CDAR_262161 [Caerostris darwini]|uniref:Uncharacterized protein n=1 Tax=Caerostris darwini TaxID=1538125 RepID=A0AAV4P879_9ARAC|nr:hypothetical protein CDAR_262161 [Caerostris darwini]